ncbi:MAG: hypothetical protein OEW89_05600 [Gammaproteobacteria bacterium]|nr:hypothetical protein [Gammaproteobacteria bacterium]MDH5594333.1 hypothetical protein [Gammaproteobacteria bacterium]MDH5614664.1 hypothetical protein [Gammaproteobacteria bacterium]
MLKDMDKPQLIARRNELRARLEAIENDYRKGLDPDSKERAVQLENAEVLTGISKAISEELQQIEEELAKHI